MSQQRRQEGRAVAETRRSRTGGLDHESPEPKAALAHCLEEWHSLEVQCTRKNMDGARDPVLLEGRRAELKSRLRRQLTRDDAEQYFQRGEYRQAAILWRLRGEELAADELVLWYLAIVRCPDELFRAAQLVAIPDAAWAKTVSRAAPILHAESTALTRQGLEQGRQSIELQRKNMDDQALSGMEAVTPIEPGAGPTEYPADPALEERIAEIIATLEAGRVGDFCNSLGLLLFGPPGTGKSHLARFFAERLQALLFPINSSTIGSPWVFGVERRLHFVEQQIRQLPADQRVVIVIDEVDSLAPPRTGDATLVHREAAARGVCLFIEGTLLRPGVLVIGTTNLRPDDGSLPAALTRAGRLGLHVEMGLPREPETRLRLWRLLGRAQFPEGFGRLEPLLAELSLTPAEIRERLAAAGRRSLLHGRAPLLDDLEVVLPLPKNLGRPRGRWCC